MWFHFQVRNLFQFDELSKLNLLFSFLGIWAFHQWLEHCVWGCYEQGRIAHYRWWGLLHKYHQEMIIVLGLLLNIATIILSYLFSMLLSDFRVQGLRSIPTCPVMALTEFFYADKCPFFATIMVFHFYFAMMASVFLYAYYISTLLCWWLAQLAGAVQYTNCISAKR